MTRRSAAAVAHPNIALVKYWGKREGVGNYPAVPSLSVTLAGMRTETRVTFDDALAADRVVLNGAPLEGEGRARAAALLDRVRSAAKLGAFADVVSRNDFPTASGLASSASGFAALAVAASRAADLDLDAERLSDLARRSSASAARSVFGGFVELDAGPEHPRGDEVCAARPIALAHPIDAAILVCVTTEESKSVGSTDGMGTTRDRSPYYAAWLAHAPQLFAEARVALVTGDFTALGEVTERSALAMHASALAAGVVYMRGATLDALAATKELRARGIGAYATMDAGPHVKVLVRGADVEAARAHLAAVPGVLRVIVAKPGPAARVVDAMEGT